MIFLDEASVTKLLPIADVLQALERAFVAQARDDIRMPLRTIAANATGLLGAMPAAIIGEHPALGAKLVTVFHDNGARGLPTHQAVIMLFDPETGQPLAVMDGRFITQIRTAATSALATKALARPGASTLAILGTGVQARAHIEALGQIMQIKEVRVWGRTASNAAAVADVARVGGLHSRVAHARLFVDTLEGARNESGAVIGAMREGHLSQSAELTRICDVIAGAARGRHTSDEVTLFQSLGIAIEDMACARLVYDRASAAGIGTKIDL